MIGVVIGCIWGYVRSLDRVFTEIYNIINNIPIIIYMTLGCPSVRTEFPQHGLSYDRLRVAGNGKECEEPGVNVSGSGV